MLTSNIVYLGERQRMALRISIGDHAITGGKAHLEPQMDGLLMAQTEKVAAKIVEGEGWFSLPAAWIPV